MAQACKHAIMPNAANRLEKGDLVNGGFGVLDDGSDLVQSHDVITRDHGSEALRQFCKIAMYGMRINGGVDDLECASLERRWAGRGAPRLIEWTCSLPTFLTFAGRATAAIAGSRLVASIVSLRCVLLWCL